MVRVAPRALTPSVELTTTKSKATYRYQQPAKALKTKAGNPVSRAEIIFLAEIVSMALLLLGEAT
jgi:hypothetical protein